MQSQSVWLSNIIAARFASSQRPSLSVDLREMRARFLLSSEVCLCSINHQLQRRGQSKYIEKNNDNNTRSGDFDILKMNGVQSLRALAGGVELFK